MAKDPAFLFYSGLYYEGTRLMLPEERGCYVDLMIYQHQNGIIPDDPKRLSMYCSGCSPEIISTVLQQKFKKTLNGWYNERLNECINERSHVAKKNKIIGIFSAALRKLDLDKKEYLELKKWFKTDDFIQIDNERLNECINERINERIQNASKTFINTNTDTIKDINTDKDKNTNSIKSIKENNVESNYSKRENLLFENPFGESFVPNWENWKEFKSKEFKFKYKSPQSEQSAINELVKLSNGDPETANQIILQSMAHGWKGFFPLKIQNTNGARVNQTKQPSRAEIQAEFEKRVAGRG